MKIEVTEYNIRNGSIRWQISTSVKVTLEHFSPALVVFKIFIFKIRDLLNIGKGHGVQRSQWHHSMADTRLSI